MQKMEMFSAIVLSVVLICCGDSGGVQTHASKKTGFSENILEWVPVPLMIFCNFICSLINNHKSTYVSCVPVLDLLENVPKNVMFL